MSSNNIEFKAMPGQVNVDEAQGIVECFVAGIGNKDSVGDVLIAGAFAKSLQRRKPRVVWGHNWNDPIGKVLEIYEVPPGDRRLPAKMLNAGIGGLYARVQFNLGSEKGREAFANVAFFGGEQEWSIGYKTLDAIFDPNIQANVLKEVELYEVSPVLHGANQLTGTISVKSDELALAEEEKGWGMMGGHHMMGQMPIKPNVIVIREEDDDKYESEKPIFAEGLSQPLGGSQRQSLEKEIMERTGSQVRLVQATESTAVFQRMMPNGTPMTFRIGYHTPDNYSTFMFGKPELVDGPSKPSGMGGKPSGSRVVVPSQMPSMPMQVKPGYDPNDMSVMPKSDLSSQLAQLEDALMEEIEEKVGKTINKKNLSKLRSILENLQDVIASAEKEEMDTKGYLIPVDVENAFHTKSMLDPIFDYHRVESVVTENGIVITSGVTKDLVEAIDNAQKGIGRSLGGGLGKGRAAGRAAFARFDPNAWDGDGDGLVQEGTPFQRPAIPGVNDRATGGKVNARRAAQAFASQSSIVPAGESVSGDVVSKNDLPEAIVTDIENYARRSVDYRTGNETPIIEGAKEVLKSLTSEKLQESVGKSISNARKKLAEMLSDEKVIEEFSSRKAIEDFTDQLRYAIEKMIDSHLDSVKKRGPSLEQSEIEEIIDNAISKFDDDFNKLIKAAKDFWDKRRKPGRGGYKTVKEAKEKAAGDRESFMKTLKDGGDPEALEEALRYIGNFTMIESDSKELLSGKMSPQDLNYFLEGALDSIIENDPSIDPKELVNEFADALREGASKDGANPLIVALAKEFGDEKITGGDLINFLNDTRQGSEYRPDRGKIEKEKIRGFASTAQRMDREEDGADYDEAFGPRSRRTNRGMREDPVGEEVAERIDRDSQNAAVRKGFASRIGVSQNPDEPRKYMDFVDAVDTFRREMSLRDIQDDYPEETWEVINNIINSSDKKLITDHLLESMSPADLKKLEDAEDINDMVMEIYDDFFNEELPKPLNDLIMDYLEGVIVDDLTGADVKKGGFTSASSGGGKNRIVRPTGIQRDERGNVDATEARNMRAERDKAVFEKLRELGLSDEEIEQLTGVPNGGRNVERGDISQDELDELNTVINEGIAEGLESGEITGVVSREEARRILKDNEGPPGNPGFASRGGGKEKLESDYNQVDMTLEEYGEIQNSIENIIKKLEDGDFGADEEIEKLKELTEKIENSTVANDMIPLEDEELTEYLGLLESMQDGGVGMDDVSKKDKDNIDSLIEALKEAQKTGSSESGKLKESGTRLSAAGKSTRSQTRNRKLTSEGTLTPAKKLSITLDDDTVSLLVEEADMIADKTKDRQSIASIKKILQDAKDGKFEVTPEQFDSITRAIEDAFENGLINSDIYGVLHQAAENADGKYDINDFIDPPKPKKGFASTGPINNGAPSDITESMQKEFIFWARRSRGLRLAQSIVEDFDKNDGKLKASQWKALRTMYANMGPGSSRGGFRSGSTSKPTAGFRDVGGPQGNNPLPYVHQTSGWKKVGGAGGLNDASVMQDPKTGKKYYVKHSPRGEEFRGESEILTSKLYQLLGIGTINYERGIHNGKLQRVSEWDDNVKRIGRNHSAKSRDPKFKASVQRSLIANAWLANWDGTGNMDNIVERNGEAVMADSGGGLLFRAQSYSGMKGQGGTDSFGPKVEEVYNLINGTTRRGQRVQGGVSDAYYKDIEPEEVARQVKELSQVTDEDIRKLVSQTISNPEDGNRLAQILIARRDWISDHWKTGKFVENPSDSSRSDASGAKARPFASVSSRSRGFASGGIDGSGDDERGGGKVTARGVGEMVPGGNMAPGRERREGERNRAGTEVGAETRFAGKKFEEVKPDNWNELTLDEKWQWAITYGNPENVENKDDAMSQVEYRKLMGNLSDEMDKEDLEAMTPAERRAEQKRRRAEQREMENMGYMPENSEKLQAKKPRLTDNEDPDEVKPVKVKKSKNAEDAKTEREARLDGLLEGIDNYRSKFDSDLSENDDHRDVWDKVSIAIQEGEYDFTIRSLDSAIEALDEYIGEYEEGQLTKAERVNIASAKAMRKQIAKARAGYVDDEWIPGQTRSKPAGGAFASASSNDVSKMKTSSKKLASDIKKDIKKFQGTGKPGARGFASTSSGGKTMITDEATFFRDVENSLSKEIRRAQKAGDNRAVKGLSKLAEIIRRDEASKTGSRRTNVGSVYFTADEADEILDGLMFALDTQLEDGGDKRVGWYSKLIEMVAKAAKSTFIDKTTKEITETTRTGTNSRGQKKKINIVPEA